MIAVLLPVLTFWTLSALANCPTVNHVTKPNSPYSRMPVNDQDGTGICYAYTASELVNYRLIESGQTNRPEVHPVWTALKASRRRLDAGFPGAAINAIRSAGVCSYESVETSVNIIGANAGLSGSPLVAFLEQYSVNVQAQVRASRANEVTPAMARRAFEQARTYMGDYCDSANIAWDQLLPELRPLNETAVQLFSRLLSDSCASPRSLQIPEPTTGYWDTLAEARNNMESYITDGPMEFSYCVNMFDDPAYVGVTWPGGATRPNCEAHSSVIVGRKEIGGACQYLVRNTWGNGWDTWNSNPGTKCLCKNKTTGAFVDECTEAEHNDGNHSVEACYFSRHKLTANTYSITSMH